MELEEAVRLNYANNTREDTQTERAQHALPPPDKGLQAWLCLAGCFTANALVWGFAFSYGIQQEYYSTHEPFSLQPGGIPAVGTTATGLSYLTMPLYFLVYRRWPRSKRCSLWISLPCMMAALIGASFANTVGELIAFQGVLYSLAGNALVVPTITYVDEWWVQKKGQAVGIMIAGDGVGGVIMPLLLNALLGSVGFRWTLRAIAGIIVVLITPLLAFLKPRIPPSAVSASRPIDISFIKGPTFWILQIFNMLQAVGYFLPSNYLPSYVQSLGLSSTFGSITILIMNLALVFGCIAVGALVDRFDVTTVLLIISILASLSVSLLWGLSMSTAPIALFSIAYGLTAGGYSTAWGGMVKDINKRYESIDTGILFGLLAAGRGIGVVLSGPLSEVLLRSSDSLREKASFAYGSEYGAIIIFSTCTGMAGGGAWLFRKLGVI